ncbi:MAG: caspase family protein [Deltaproteobacteria bacterium]|nr:caspase family protein [Deltaproteobacteria bacterium]
MSKSRFSPLRLLSALALAAALLLPSVGRAEAPMTGRTHAVLVGIASYPTSPLARTDVDAERLARALTRNIPAERLSTHLLLNERATRANVMQALATVQREATEGDNVVFFFSGHGSPVADESADEGDALDEVLALYDGDLKDDELAHALDQTKSRLTLVGIDACFSGGFLFDVGDRAGRMTLLSSSEDLTSAVPDREAGGWLSLLLAEALEGQADGAANGVQGQARDGMLTALEIEAFIRRKAGQLPNIESTDPAGRTVGFQFIDIKRTAVRPDMVVMQVGEGTGEFVAPQVVMVGTQVASFPNQRLSPQGATHTVDLVAGTRYLFETRSLGGAADTVMALVQGGQVLAENDDAAPNDLSSRIEFTATQNGRHEVRVRPYAPNTLGEYSLRVATLDGATPITTVTPSGDAVFQRSGLSLSPSGEQFTVQLAPGRYVVATGSLSGQADTMVRVLLNGTPVAENDDVTDGDLSSRIELSVGSAGTYTIEVRPYGPQTLGTYALAVTRGGAATTVAPATGNELHRVTSQLTAAGEDHTIQVPGGPVVISTSALGPQTDTVIEVLANGVVLGQNDDASPNDLSSRLEVMAPAGTLTVRVRPYAPQTLGAYTLTVASGGSAPVATVGSPVLSMPGQTLGQNETTHEVQLEAGRTYVFETRVHGSADTVLQLRQGGRVLAENDDIAPDQLGSRIELTAPAAGAYTIAVRPYAPMTTGSYDLNVTVR